MVDVTPSLHSDLLYIKHTADPNTLFPSHAYGRGGVGHFLCTGHMRAGIHRLPQAASKAASLSLTARSRYSSSRSGLPGSSDVASSVSGFSLISTDPVSVGATRAWETGSVQHSGNFITTSRSVRTSDLPRGSKWTAVSFFENNPRELARHMAILDNIQVKSDNLKAAERQTEQARHNLWAEQQRGMFRRQRLEQAAKYTRSGLRPRSAYAELGALEAAEAVHGTGPDGGGAAAAGAIGSDAGGAASAGGPVPDPVQRFFASVPLRGAMQSRASLTSTGRPLVPHSATASGKARPATALPGGLAHLPGGDPFAATLTEAAAMHAANGGRPTVLPLPKMTYVKVYDRMAAEATETPAARAAAVMAAKAAEQEERAAAVRTAELQELDTFEARMRSLQRARSRARIEGRPKGPGFPEDE